MRKVFYIDIRDEDLPSAKAYIQNLKNKMEKMK